MPSTTTLRIPVADLAPPARRVPVRPRSRRARRPAGTGRRVAGRDADRRRPHARAGPRGHRRARRPSPRTWTAACSRCLAPVGGDVAVHVDELFETPAARRRDLPARRRRHRPRAAGPRRAAARAAARAAVPARLPGLCPTLRRRPQRHVAATARPTSPTPAGRRCGRSSSDPSTRSQRGAAKPWPSRSAR